MNTALYSARIEEMSASVSIATSQQEMPAYCIAYRAAERHTLLAHWLVACGSVTDHREGVVCWQFVTTAGGHKFLKNPGATSKF